MIKYDFYDALRMVKNGMPMITQDGNPNMYLGMISDEIVFLHTKDDSYKCDAYINGSEKKSFYIPYIKVKLSDDEKAILRNIDTTYKWISRDSDSILTLYAEKPKRCSNFWDLGEGIDNTIYENMSIFNHLFQQIKWEDTEPKLISDLLKEC